MSQMDGNRRLSGLGVLVTAVTLLMYSGSTWAQTPSTTSLAGRTLTIATFGGAFLEAGQTNFGVPFSQDTGVKVTYVPAAPAITSGVIQQEQTGNVQWDLIENTDIGEILLRNGGYLDKWPTDLYNHMKQTATAGQFDEYVLGAGASSFLIACNSKLVSKCPTNARQFFDVQNYPGSRAIYGDASWATVLALEADGVAPDKIFPMDLTRAFNKLKQIKPQIKVWPTTSAQAQQLLADGETAISFLAHGRAYLVKKDNPAIQISWDGALYSGGGLMMPKNAPNKDVAIVFVRWYLDHPKNQAAWSQALSYPTPTKDLLKLLPPEVADAMPTAHKSLPRDAAWFAANNDTLQKLWQQFITGQ